MREPTLGTYSTKPCFSSMVSASRMGELLTFNSAANVSILIFSPKLKLFLSCQ
jgi:hypothetical protein